MTPHAALLLIADIAGYTRFMKLHTASLIHAQDIVGQLLEAMIAAAGPRLALAKLEGDAAFFYAPLPPGGRVDGAAVAALAADMHRAFHAKAADLAVNTLCPCDGCQQAGHLRVKFVGHAGEVVERVVGGSRELAGLAVILVHRLLKNRVPVGEYLLVTEPLYESLDTPLRAAAANLPTDVDDLGRTPTWYVTLAGSAGQAERLPLLARLARQLGLVRRSIPYAVGRREACAGFRNLAS